MWYRCMFSIHLIYTIVIAMQCTLVPEQEYTNYSSQVTQTLNQYKLQGHCSPLSVRDSTGTTWISSSLLWHPSYKAVLQRSDHLNLLSFAHKMWRSLVWIGRRPPHWQYPRGNVGSECSILHTYLFWCTGDTHNHMHCVKWHFNINLWRVCQTFTAILRSSLIKGSSVPARNGLRPCRYFDQNGLVFIRAIMFTLEKTSAFWLKSWQGFQPFLAGIEDLLSFMQQPAEKLPLHLF